jgi:bifunctional DNA-binding transcriptional regulator/antitoxin component of YhaV-PrlF toxin-antitoxin module
MRTTISARGQTVVPAKIRRDHEIEAQSRLEWLDDGHTIRVVPVPEDSIRAAKGSTKGFGSRLLKERRRERDRA